MASIGGIDAGYALRVVVDMSPKLVIAARVPTYGLFVALRVTCRCRACFYYRLPN